jgi:hypothetical protein
MRDALKGIAGFANPAADQSDGGQAAARVAREALEELRLYYARDVENAS